MRLLDKSLGRDVDEQVLRELVAYLYGGLHAVASATLAFGCVVAVGYVRTGDVTFLGIGLIGLILGAIRCAVFLCAPELRRSERTDRANLERFQVRYLSAGAPYAIAVGLLCARGAFLSDDMTFLLGVLIAATFSLGLLVYVAVRPAICAVLSIAPCVLGGLGAAASPFEHRWVVALLFVMCIFVCIRGCRQQYDAFSGLYRARKQLADLALLDPLTGLANRRALETEIEASGDQAAAVLYLDLDRFKPVNDTYGHAVGDKILRQVAGRIRAVVREGDVVARTGGDEFVVLLRGDRASAASSVAERVRAAIAAHYDADGVSASIGVSVGVHVGRPGQAIVDVVREADVAMFADKQAGRGAMAAAA